MNGANLLCIHNNYFYKNYAYILLIDYKNSLKNKYFICKYSV